MKSTINGNTTTYFVGAHYELSGATVTKYYYAGAQRIAMRSNGTLSYLLGDHLGSTSLTTDAARNKVSEVRYKAWGEVRYAWGNVPTKYQYTGQFSYEQEFGLYFYNARWYDSYLNHMTQPDTIVPDQYNPQDWNRYAYARNNPLRYNDPSGHIACDDTDSDGTCINYEQQNRRLHKKLKDFVAPEKVKDDEMVTVGIWPFLAQISPAEYALLLDKNGNLDYGLLYKMYQIQQNALNTAGDLFPGMNLHNDPADAFRHAYWNALLTREFGEEFAGDFTSAHETGYAPYPNDEEAFMDLHNNAVGRDIAFSSPGASDEQLQQKVMDALRDGDLYVWDGNDIYFSNMCPVCFFP